MRRTEAITGPEERHRQAVAQTVEWAHAAASAGDYREALAWIRVLVAVEGGLPAELEALCELCLANIATRIEGALKAPRPSPRLAA